MESPNFTVDFERDILTTATHLYSGTRINMDAPLDNFGKASSFSPTDLVSASLSSCMMSVVAINYKNRGLELKPIQSQVKKVMASNPRRISEIHIEFDFGTNNFSKEELEQVARLMHACPVAHSLHPEIKIVTNLEQLIAAS